MKNKQVITLLAVSSLATSGVLTNKTAKAATRVKLKHSARIYNSKGLKTKHKLLKKGKYVSVSKIKKINTKYYYKIGKNKYIRKNNVTKFKKFTRKKDSIIYQPLVYRNLQINLDKTKKLPSAKSTIANRYSLPKKTKFSWDKNNKPVVKRGGKTNGKIIVTYPDKSKDVVNINYIYHGKNRIKLPVNYTLAELKISDVSPTNNMISAAYNGKKNNYFTSESSEDDQEQIDYYHLTNKQKKKISKFVLKLINGTRKQVKRPKWKYTNSVQNLADDIALNYQQDGHGAQDHAHYINGITSAAIQHGYTTDGSNQFEDMYGIANAVPRTMTDLKRLTYRGMICLLFNGYEFHHAADILSGHNNSYWNSTTFKAPFAVSFSRVGNWNTVHYIRVPSNVKK